jgi:outer membrane protein assembly factor BamB
MLASIAVGSPCCALAQQTASPPVPEAKPQRDASQLVEQLGAEKWSDRKSASDRLMAGGDEVAAALRQGLGHADAEVRRQSRRLLADRVKSELQLGITDLREDKKTERARDLPGWERYQKEVGTDVDARKLFAEMLTDEAALLFACQAGGRIASKAANSRLRQVMAGLYNRVSSERRTPSRGTIAAMIFAAAHPDTQDEIGLLTGQWMSNLIRQSAFVTTLNPKKPSRASQKLVGLWMRSKLNGQEVYSLQIAISYRIKDEGMKLAMQVLADANAHATNVVTLALEAVTRLGEKKYSRLLVPLLKDKRGCRARMVNNKRMQIQIQDIALVWLVWSTGQEPAPYGFPRAKTYLDRLKSNPTNVTSTSYFYFDSEEKRQAGLKKWAEWVAKNPLPELPADAITKPTKEPGEPAVIAQNPGGAVKPGAVQETRPDNEPRGVPVADRVRMQMLRRAQELLVENPGHLEAISLIGKLLTEDREWVFRTEGETPVYRTIRSEAEDIISRLTPRQLQLYEQQFGKLARADFADAVAEGTSDAVAKIVEKYFFTRAGADAAYWIASMQVDRGQFFPAALWLSRLKRSHPAATQFEPTLSVLHAFCWYESGVTERAENALNTLREAGHTSVEIFGENHPLPSREETGPWLAAVFANHGSHGSSAAELISGLTPIEQRPMHRVRIETVHDESVKRALKLVDSMHEQFGVAAIPQTRPVVVGDAVIFRTLTELKCVSFSSSQTRWQSSVLSGLDTLVAATSASGKKTPDVTLARALREQIWDRSAASSLVTDGRRVFAVEDVSLDSGGHFPGLEILPDGTPTLREGSGKTHNRLTAWDVGTGKVLWECGGPPIRRKDKETEGHEAEAQPVSRSLAGVRFIGAPQPIGDQLCVLGQVEDQIELVLIESATGEVVWTSTLHMPDETAPTTFTPWMPFSKTGSSTSSVTGSVPVLSDDTVFVYVGYNRYVAFDLASRRVLWAYEEKRNADPGPPNRRNMGAIQKFASMQMTAPDRWIHATPNVVGDRVLITPPATDLLVCLDRDSGRVVWEVPREDGLFVSGIVDGVALIVGRSSVRGIRIADGKSGWKEPSVALPDGVQPAGQGIVVPVSSTGSKTKRSELHLPQAHGMVAVLDITTGRWSTGEWKIDGPAGNLTLGLAAIVSQDATGVTIFDRIDETRQQTIANLAADSTDVDALTVAAEMSLQADEVARAIDFATRAIKAGGGQNAEDSLALALTTSLRRTPKNAAAAQESVRETLESAKLLSAGKGKADVLRAVAGLQRENGQLVAALDSWLKIIELRSGDLQKLRPQSFVWRVRDDRWIQAELSELFATASAADRKTMTERMLAFRESKSHGAFIRFFGFHESANVSRIAQAESEITAKQLLVAEQLLLPVARTGSVKERAKATRLLVELLKGAGQNEPAQRHAKSLAASVVNDSSADGQAAQAMAESLLQATKNPLSPDAAFPIGPVSVDEFKVSTAERSKWVTGYALLPESRADDYQTGTVELDSRLTTLFARDALGRQKWKISVKDAATSTIRYLRYAVRYNQSRCARQGELTVSWIGDQVCAVDGIAKTGKPLWTQTCYVSNPLDPNSQQYRPRFRPQTVTHLDAQKLPLVVTPNYVCFQRGRKLVAVDPLDGSTLWWRDDLPMNCDLTGDSELVFARKPDEATAIVLRGLDGKKLGTREVPEIADRVMSRGRRCVTAKTVGDKFEVIARDLWTQRILWQRMLVKGSHIHVVNAQEVAILQKGGQFEVVDADSGQVLASADLNTPDSISDIVVQRRLDRLVVVVNEPEKAKNPIQVLQQPTPGHRSVNGELYILADDGEEISHSRFEQQSLKLNQPEQLPLLILFRRYQERKPVGKAGGFTYGQPKTKVALIDVRSGRTVHQFDRRFGSDTDYQLVVKPAEHQLELTTRTVGLRIDYSEP